MGAYRYLLKNETRRPKIDGVRETVYSMPFSHKLRDEGWGSRRDANVRGRRFDSARKTWEENEIEFVAYGGFEEGNYVYRPSTYHHVDESDKPIGTIVGFLHKRGNGKWEVRSYGPWLLVTMLDTDRGHRVAELSRSTIRGGPVCNDGPSFFGGYGKVATEIHSEFPDNADFWRHLYDTRGLPGGAYDRYMKFSIKRSLEFAAMDHDDILRWRAEHTTAT